MLKHILLAGALLSVSAAQAQQFPSTLPPNTVVGRLGVSAGPAQAIPFSVFQSQIGFTASPLIFGLPSAQFGIDAAASSCLGAGTLNSPFCFRPTYSTGGGGGGGLIVVPQYGILNAPANIYQGIVVQQLQSNGGNSVLAGQKGSFSGFVYNLDTFQTQADYVVGEQGLAFGTTIRQHGGSNYVVIAADMVWDTLPATTPAAMVGITIENNVAGMPFMSVYSANNLGTHAGGSTTTVGYICTGGSPNVQFGQACVDAGGNAIQGISRLIFANALNGRPSPGAGDFLIDAQVGDYLRINGGGSTGGVLFTTKAAAGTQGSFIVANNSVDQTVTMLVDSLSNIELPRGGVALKTPRTITAASDSPTLSDHQLIANFAGIVTLTLPSAATIAGKYYYIKTITANTVVSASSNVVPRTTATPGTAILAAAAGNWTILQSDGTNWISVAGTP